MNSSGRMRRTIKQSLINNMIGMHVSFTCYNDDQGNWISHIENTNLIREPGKPVNFNSKKRRLQYDVIVCCEFSFSSNSEPFEWILLCNFNKIIINNSLTITWGSDRRPNLRRSDGDRCDLRIMRWSITGKPPNLVSLNASRRYSNLSSKSWAMNLSKGVSSEIFHWNYHWYSRWMHFHWNDWSVNLYKYG